MAIILDFQSVSILVFHLLASRIHLMAVRSCLKQPLTCLIPFPHLLVRYQGGRRNQQGISGYPLVLSYLTARDILYFPKPVKPFYEE